MIASYSMGEWRFTLQGGIPLQQKAELMHWLCIMGVQVYTKAKENCFQVKKKLMNLIGFDY